VDAVKIFPEKTARECVNWIHVPLDRIHRRDFCKHDNETSNSIEGGEFLDQLSDSQLLKDGSLVDEVSYDFSV
jgi:hypothetical protein